MDFHNPYSGHCLDSFAGAILPWHERSARFEKEALSKIQHVSYNNFVRKVSFEEKVYIILIPSRNDMRNFYEDIWWTESEISRSKVDAESELKLSLSSNESFLSLYSAMNLLYRPCSTNNSEIKSKNHFRILVVDESRVSRKMTMFSIAQGHRWAKTKELLFLQQASDYESAKECISSREYNVIIIDDNLTDQNKSTWSGRELVRLVKLKSPNCVIIGMSSDLLNPLKTKQITNMFMRSGKRIRLDSSNILLFILLNDYGGSNEYFDIFSISLFYSC